MDAHMSEKERNFLKIVGNKIKLAKMIGYKLHIILFIK